MDAINVINQNKILVDVLYRGTVNLIDIVIGDAMVYEYPTVVVKCYTTDLAFATTERILTNSRNTVGDGISFFFFIEWVI